MSYDISFVVKVEGINEHVRVGSCEANITWNVHTLIKESSGWHIQNEACNGLMEDLAEKLGVGLYELRYNAKKYKQFESPNGWGTIDWVINFYVDILMSWRELKREQPKIAKVAQVYVS